LCPEFGRITLSALRPSTSVTLWIVGEKALKLPSTVEGALAEHLGETPGGGSDAPRLDGSAL